ncbi:MAG: FMN-binding protein [Desulfobacterium sp.]
MLMKDRFKELMPEISSIKRISEDGEIYWHVFDNEKTSLGYAFFIAVPETDDPNLDVEEFDKYEVACVISLEYQVLSLKISEHPEGPDNMWAEDIIEDEFAQQYLNRPAKEMYLAPEGAIDAISDGTLSSKLMTDSIRDKIISIKDSTQ